MAEAKRRVFGRGTPTYQAFEKLFFLEQEQYPYRLGPWPKGKAINLTQGLNCCNIQWAEGQGMPLSMLQFSAKAIKGGNDNDWFLEISTNYKQQGIASPQGRNQDSGWILEIVNSAPKSIYEQANAAEVLSGQGPSPSPAEHAEPEEDASEALLRKLGFTS